MNIEKPNIFNKSQQESKKYTKTNIEEHIKNLLIQNFSNTLNTEYNRNQMVNLVLSELQKFGVYDESMNIEIITDSDNCNISIIVENKKE